MPAAAGRARPGSRRSVIEGQLSLFDIAGRGGAGATSRSPSRMWESTPRRNCWPLRRKSWASTSAAIPWRNMRTLWRKNVTAMTVGFYRGRGDGEGQGARTAARVVIGGMITGKTVKDHQDQPADGLHHPGGSGGIGGGHRVSRRITRPTAELFTEDAKVFIRGRVSVGDDPVGKLICEQVMPFDAISQGALDPVSRTRTVLSGQGAGAA